MVSELSDPFIHRLIAKHGPRGYMIYYRTLSIMAHEFRVETPGILRTNREHLKNILGFQHVTLQKVYEFIAKQGKFKIEYSGEEIIITCPKFKELADDYTGRQLYLKRKRLRTNSEQVYGECSVRLDKIRLDKKEKGSSLQAQQVVENSDRSGGATRQKALRPSRFFKIDSLIKKILGKITQED
jgi:hypothetical protein